MADDIFEGRNVHVTIYAGPASLGLDRRMVQVTPLAEGGYAAMSWATWRELVQWIIDEHDARTWAHLDEGIKTATAATTDPLVVATAGVIARQSRMHQPDLVDSLAFCPYCEAVRRDG